MSHPHSGLPPDVMEVFQKFRTAEFTTIAKSGLPSTWPILPVYDASRGQFLVTTSIGLPQKAFNVRRNGRVALLYSDPTGAGMAHPPAVLVQGDAVATDQIITDVRGHKDFWAETYRRQPASGMYSTNALTRYLFDWYYMRIFIHITPRRILWWDAGDFSQPPQEHLPATHPAAAEPPIAAPDPDSHEELAGAFRQLARYETVVLTAFDATGYPYSIRTKANSDPENRRILLEATGSESLVSGPANVLGHFHDDKLWGLHNLCLRGQLHTDAGQLRLEVRQASGTSGSIGEMIPAIRRLRRTAKNYLARRGLDRPQIPWDDLNKIKKQVLRK